MKFRKKCAAMVFLAGTLLAANLASVVFADDAEVSANQMEYTSVSADNDTQAGSYDDPDPKQNDPEYWKKAENNDAPLVGGAAEDRLTHDSRFSGNYNLHYGIDVSRYDGTIDWNKVKKSGRDFAIVRMGYRASGNGRIWEDPTGKRNLAGALNAGLRVGVYIFSQALNENEARQEADWLYNSVRGYENRIKIPYVMDYEYASGPSGNQGRLYRARLSRTQASDCVNAFISEIQAKNGRAMLYANTSFLKDQVNTSRISSACDYWVARYARAANYSGPYTYWQYSESGRVDGVSAKNCDLDVWYEETGSDTSETSGAMYRLYNPNSGEHFYTESKAERNHLVSLGWRKEGTAWVNPKNGIPVYRVYNPNSGEHHYTVNKGERDFLVKVGWRDEGIGWHAAQNGTAVYRLYNPNAKDAGSHHYTTNAGERDWLVKLGWRYEGIGWYAV